MQPPLSFWIFSKTDLDKTLDPILRAAWMPSSCPDRPRTSATNIFYCPSSTQFRTNRIGILKELLTFWVALRSDAGGCNWRTITCRKAFTNRRTARTSLPSSFPLFLASNRCFPIGLRSTFGKQQANFSAVCDQVRRILAEGKSIGVAGYLDRNARVRRLF